MKKSKSVLVLSDLHCGSEVGLTMPHWSYKKIKNDREGHNKFAELQKKSWDWFSSEVKGMKPDVVICVGDLVDGQDYKGSGAGQLTTNMEKQAQMAIDILEFIGGKKHVFVYGSGYHTTTNGIEVENMVAQHFASRIGNQQFIDVNGLTFNIKHKCGRTSIPHGRGTLLHKQKLWEQMWSIYKDFPESQVLLRGHVHYYYAVQDTQSLMMTLPSMKTLGDKFGGKNFVDIVDYGFVEMNVQSVDEYEFKPHIANLELSKPKIIKM